MVLDKDFKAVLNEYKRKTNMDVKSLKKWRRSKDYERYLEVKSGEPASVALERNLMLQRKIEDGSISKAQYGELRKAVNYLERAKAEYRQEGAGDNKIPGGSTTKRVAALRGWAFDPYGSYS